MRISAGGIIGFVFALVPIVYIGWLLRHFIGVGGGTAEGIAGIGLGPTVLGLSIVGLLFALPLVIKLLRAVTGVNRVPGARQPAEEASLETAGFDADAALANYMRNRDAAGAAPVEPPASEGPGLGAPRPQGFGRKIV